MFLSIVSKISKPAASATSSNSPVVKLSHPRSIDSRTVWLVSDLLSGAGMPLSNRMSIDRVRGGGLLWTGRVKTPRSEFEHSRYLLARDVEPVHNLVDRGSGL